VVAEEGAIQTGGVLKAGWMHRHATEFPAVVLLLMEMDMNWDQGQWQAKESWLATMVAHLKGMVRGREAKVVVVLIKWPALGGIFRDTDETTEQWVGGLRRKCDLDPKSLFVLSQADFAPLPSPGMKKLQRQVKDFVTRYYDKAANNRRKWQKGLPRFQAQVLLARYSFKRAYLQEFTAGASVNAFQAMLSSYQDTAKHLRTLLEVAPDTMVSQIRAAADFAAFKLCRHLLWKGRTEDARSHFTAHLHFFKKNTLNKPNPFVFQAWAAQQYLWFVQMLESCEASKFGKGKDYQDSGYYYLAAATHATKRREAFEEAMRSDEYDPTSLSDSQVEPTVTYVGDIVSFRDPTLSQQQMEKAIQVTHFMKEQEVDHFHETLDLLLKALDYCSTEGFINRRRGLVHWAIGKEHAAARQWEGSWGHLQEALNGQEKDGWLELAGATAQLMLQAAYHLARPKDYIFVAMKLIGSSIGQYVQPEQRIKLFGDMLNLVQSSPGQELALYCGSYSAKVSVQQPMQVSSQDVFEVQAFFKERSATPGQVIFVEIHVVSNFPGIAHFSKIEIAFKNTLKTVLVDPSAKATPKTQAKALDPVTKFSASEETTFLSHSISSSSSQSNSFETLLIFEQGRMQKFVVPLELPEQAGADTISFSSADCTLEVGKGHQIALQVKNTPLEPLELKAAALRIVPSRPKASIHPIKTAPALVGLLHKIDLEITGGEDSLVNPTLRLTCEPPPQTPSFDEAFFWGPKEGSPDAFVPLKLAENLQPAEPLILVSSGPNEKQVVSFYVCINEERTAMIRAQLEYKQSEKSETPVSTETQFTVQSQNPFAVHFSCISPQEYPCAVSMVEQPSTGFLNDPMLLSATLQTSQYQPIRIYRVEMEMPSVDGGEPQWKPISDVVLYEANDQEEKDSEGTAQSSDLRERDTLTVFFRALASKVGTASLGQLRVHWGRLDEEVTLQASPSPPQLGEKCLRTVSVFSCPEVRVVDPPYGVRLIVPPQAQVGEPLILSWEIRNKGQFHDNLQLKVSGGQNFLWMGHRQCEIQVAPGETYKMTCKLVPVVTGHLELPLFDLVSSRHQSSVIKANQVIRTRHIYVCPNQQP